jgi:hypothetical protein
MGGALTRKHENGRDLMDKQWSSGDRARNLAMVRLIEPVIRVRLNLRNL